MKLYVIDRIVFDKGTFEFMNPIIMESRDDAISFVKEDLLNMINTNPNRIFGENCNYYIEECLPTGRDIEKMLIHEGIADIRCGKESTAHIIYRVSTVKCKMEFN